MEIHFFCPSCSRYNRVANVSGLSECICDGCHKSVKLIKQAVGESADAIPQCVVCGKSYFYNRPEFNRGLGCLILLAAAILSVWTYGISLIVAGLIDWILFKKLPRIAVCYICDTEYKGSTRRAPDFDLHLHEKYKSEKRGQTPSLRDGKV